MPGVVYMTRHVKRLTQPLDLHLRFSFSISIYQHLCGFLLKLFYRRFSHLLNARLVPPVGTMPKSYAPLQDSIPEEDRFSDDESSFRLRRVDRSSRHGSHSPKDENETEPSILAPLVRKSADFETYLDTLTEDEQQLLSASKDHELDDLDPLAESKGAARRFSESKRRRHLLAKQGWRAVYYSKTWWRTLVVVIIALGLLIWGFLRYASSRGEFGKEYVR